MYVISMSMRFVKRGPVAFIDAFHRLFGQKIPVELHNACNYTREAHVPRSNVQGVFSTNRLRQLCNQCFLSQALFRFDSAYLAGLGSPTH